MRTLRSKQARNALWIAADGKCALCGRQLPDDWHADHITPFSVSGTTNVHEMQALCPECNLRKGAMTFRSHQQEFDLICRQIATSPASMPEFIFNHVCPGGGKSSLPVIAAHWLISVGKVADKICWIVPNAALREQASAAFAKDRYEARMLGHNLEIHESINSQNPSKGSAGYVTTYKAIECDGGRINIQEFEARRYILVLDEFHHLACGGAWQQAVMPLVERSRLVIGMTGTLDRADRCPIYLLPYGTDRLVKKDHAPNHLWVNYDIKQATADKAIIRVHFEHVDGAAKWYDESGVMQEATELGDNDDALGVALRTEYAIQLLGACADHWSAHKKANRRSKMLVVCKETKQAQLMVDHLRVRGFGDAEIATYQQDDADESIRRFRLEEKPDILVTVAKAYEGLDVPRITHIACLTHIRSRPWIEQMLARGWRYDPQAGPWSRQYCYAYVPADEAFLDCIRNISEGQQQAAKDIDERARSEQETKTHDDGSRDYGTNGITPLASAKTVSWASELGGNSLTPEETEYYRQLGEDLSIPAGPLQIKELIEENERRKHDWKPSGGSAGVQEPSLSKRITALRKTLEELVRTAASGRGDECARINSIVKDKFGSRDAMTEQQLIDAIQLLRKMFRGRL